MRSKDTSGHSTVQTLVESEFRTLLKKYYGEIKSKKINLTDGTSVVVDGVDNNNNIFVEIYSHQGNLGPGQRKKILTDLFKLMIIKYDKNVATNKYIYVFANNKIESYLTRNSWASHAVKIFGIILKNVTAGLSDETKNRLLLTQSHQATHRKNKIIKT
ncbi:MAG: hypothetical protein HQM16_17710 [Deltaproteobacteria bacterium]|nr:hypothetical protein [Deltaproteobacteria bacterium]